RDERVPVRDASPRARGVQVDAGETEGGWDEHRAGSSAGCDGPVVEQKLSIEATRAPAREHRAHGTLVEAEQFRDRRQVGREPDHGADVQVAVRPAIEAPADAGCEGIVDRGVAEGALNADRRDLAALIEVPGDADHRVELQQRKRGRRVVEVDLPALEQLAQRVRERVEVDLEPDGERARGAETRTHAAVLGAGDRLVEVKLAAPEVL